jgi:threonine aldolase
MFNYGVCWNDHTGLGAPAGSLLIGPKDFITRAHRCRKALGGGMRQVGVLAAAALVALDDFEAGMLHADHTRAQRVAKSLAVMRGYHLEVESVHTNIVIVSVDVAMCVPGGSHLSSNYVVEYLAKQGLLIISISPSAVRVTLHRDITDECVDDLIKGFQEVSESLLG